MSYLWKNSWFDFSEDTAVLENISKHWNKIGHENLGDDDIARLEPFLEPFDAIYSEEEIVILSRLGNNGVQKEFCHVFHQEDKWVLEWYLDPKDVKRKYLTDICLVLFGDTYEQDVARCMTMLIYTLSSLRKLKVHFREDQSAYAERDLSLEPLEEGSLEDVEVE